jgi:hypothetical protein
MFRYRKGIIHLNSEVPDSALNFGMTEQELDSSQVTRSSVDQRRFRPPERMGAEELRV